MTHLLQQGHIFYLPNSATNWRPIIPTSKPMGDMLIQTTTAAEKKRAIKDAEESEM